MKMKSLSRVGLGLSVVFTCLLLALVAEIYYLLWWKRRLINRKIEDGFSKPRREFFYLFCWKKHAKSSVNVNSTTIPNSQIQESSDQEFQFQSQNNKDYFGTELIMGQPRFLFTIKEETKEDLESEDGKSREGKRSLSDLLKNNVENNPTPPFLTPLSSPPFLTPPITPLGSCHSSQSGGYNPFYESSTDAEFNKIVKSSPPPKFKFLRDAEEKLQRKIMLFEQAKQQVNLQKNKEEDGSFIRIIVAKNKEDDKLTDHHYHSPYCISGDTSSSQVLPLASSPSNLAPSNRKFKNFLTL